jgi:hypothetical protein
MAPDPFDSFDTPVPGQEPVSDETTAGRPSVFIKSVTAQVLTKSPESESETNGPETIAPTVRPAKSEGWLRTDSEIMNRPYIEYAEEEPSDISIQADQDGVYINIGDQVIAITDRPRVERLLHTIERAWDDHEFLTVLKEKDESKA